MAIFKTSLDFLKEMMSQNSLTDCRFCCIVSKANGEDPIGTAGTYEHWLAMEMDLPWTEKRLLENSILQSAIAHINKLILEDGVNIRGQLLVPDKEYSHAGYTRIFYYHRPAKLFAVFEKHEFVIPNADVDSFLIALLETISQPLSRLTDWQKYRQDSSHIRELMVCTDGSVDVACSRFGYPIYRKLRFEYANANGQLRVWRVSHFGGHQFAPTLLDWPAGHCWGHLSPEILELLLWRSGSVSGLRPFYRGWSGLTKFEQIVEREIWMQQGWDWLNYHKSGQVLASDEVNQEWADVRIDFSTMDSSMRSAYKARVEVSGSVMTAWNSANEQLLEQVKQYRVSHLVQLNETISQGKKDD